MNCGGSKDLISGLPEALIGHILSFLPTKEAASTSVLSRKWRYLFVLVHNLDFDYSVYVNPPEEEKVLTRIAGFEEMVLVQRRNNVSTSFMDFVDRVLALQGNSFVHKFSLKIRDGDDPVDPVRIFGWILNVLERGVSDLDLCMDLESESLFPSKIILSATLVSLKLDFIYDPAIVVEDVYLPNLKTLCLVSVHFSDHGVGLSKLLSGCHMLEELVLDGIGWSIWDFSYVSVTTLKRLTYCWEERFENPTSVSFDTPNLVYLEFTDTISDKYPNVNFGSLVEAKINLRMTENQVLEAQYREEGILSDGTEEDNLIGNVTDFLIGICNVKILDLSADTLQVLTHSCEAMPLFNNLTHLTIESEPEVGWQSLPGLLKNSPKLETLVLQGLVHEATDACGDMCLCETYEDEEEIPTCLSSSPVKVLKIMKFGEFRGDNDLEKQIKQVKHFLESMPNLEQLIIYYDTSVVEDVIELSCQLQRLPRAASSKCNIQLISDHLTLSV